MMSGFRKHMNAPLVGGSKTGQPIMEEDMTMTKYNHLS